MTGEDLTRQNPGNRMVEKKGGSTQNSGSLDGFERNATQCQWPLSSGGKSFSCQHVKEFCARPMRPLPHIGRMELELDVSDFQDAAWLILYGVLQIQLRTCSTECVLYTLRFSGKHRGALRRSS